MIKKSTQQNTFFKRSSVVASYLRSYYHNNKKPRWSNLLSEFVYLRTYAKWLEQEKRRETWQESVSRYMKFMQYNLGELLTPAEYQSIENAILHQEVMPSMRLMQFAGEAMQNNHIYAYNCSYIAPQSWQDIAEIMYICLSGVGVGFSVEQQNIRQFPKIKAQQGVLLPTHVIADSKEGWCDALSLGLKTWSSGHDIHFDFSQIRPAGTRLKTFGGKSAGAQPLENILLFARQILLQRQNSKLTSLDVHDLICKIGEMISCVGIRRSAMISLSDLTDKALQTAKTGKFFQQQPQRAYANNSAVYLKKPTRQEFMQEWQALQHSGTGERGIFNRAGLIHSLPERRKKLLQKSGLIKNNKVVGMIGTNPCGEIILQSKQFCNLTEVIAKPNDNLSSLLHKIYIATILGTYQATLTKFSYLSPSWQQQCQLERLLGVSITGQWDCEVVRNKQVLTKLKKCALQTNQIYAQRFNINTATSVTCVKPSGTVSQLVNSASGLHPRFAPYYIRRVRIAANDSLFKFLKQQGISYTCEVGQTISNANTFVLEFPIQSPPQAICLAELTALQQLNYWRKIKQYFTEHNPSVTIAIAKQEWQEVAVWLLANWPIVGGLSFMPKEDHVYPLAPYTRISEQEFKQRQQKIKCIKLKELLEFEQEDDTDLLHQLSCICDID